MLTGCAAETLERSVIISALPSDPYCDVPARRGHMLSSPHMITLSL